MNETGRKRIVINLDQPSGAQPRKKRTRRWPKVLAFLLVLIIVVVVIAAAGGYFWWRHFQTTPSYSIALILDAAQHDDMAALDQQLDNDEIARNMVGSFRQKAAGRYGAALSGPLQSQLDSLLPLVQPRFKQTVHDELAKQIKEFAAKSTPKPFVIVALTVPSLMKIDTQGDIAQVTATVQERTIQLSMRRDGERWKVTALNDDTLTQRVVDDMMKELPAIGQSSSPETRKKQKTRRR